MPKIDEATRLQRLERISLLLMRNARGLTEGEIADEMRMERRSVNNYLRDLETQGKAFKDGLYWFPLILKESRLRSFDLSPEEAVTLYLGARLLSKQQDKRNEPAETALLKLASVLKADAGIGAEIEQAARELAQRPVQKEYQPIFRDVVRGYIYRKKIEITYRPLNWNKSFTTIFSTYLLEPSPIGFTTYLIGHSSIVDKWRAYKLERIESVRLTKEEYALPPDFPGLDILRNAWSIVLGEETLRVVLRFSERVKARVLETRWHPSQQTRDDTEKLGSLLWEVQVADTLDLLPWIRSWGADCEVLEPDRLRKDVIQHVRDLASQYKVMPSEIEPYLHLWAKADRKDEAKIHRLIYHLIDVGQVALAMWNKAVDAESKRQFCQWLKCDEDTAGRTLAFLMSLHDLGKASPDFQIKVIPAAQEVAKAGFTFPKMKSPNPAAHGTVSAYALKDLLQSDMNLSKQNARFLAQAIGGHHGAWIHPMEWQAALTDNTGGPEWETARKELLQAMMEIFNPAIGFTLPQEDKERNAFLILFSGFTSVADWIGSMTEFFPYEKNINIPMKEYSSHAEANAKKALTELGWFNWRADGKKLTFVEMFPFISSPNSVQQKIVEEVANIPLPALLILESPTGSGKTEAALYTADSWLQSQCGSGMYIAMPTQATSNQMYKRTSDFLLKRYPDQNNLNFHLVHGGALLEDNKVQTERIYDEDQTDSQGGIRAEAWFLPRKRTLLAPFGVGTVDQALMSVLQTRHFFVRMFGLQNKVVIFDEVHAYDTYMSELFKRLLAWLRQIGVSVILLSATLPEKTRRELTAAYLGSGELELPPAEYPRLTIASEANVKSITLETPSSRTVQLRQCDVQPQTIIDHLRTALQHGGSAAVICNRVKRAQDLYKEIQAAGLVPEEDLILFHARFPFSWREQIETSVLGKFGKGENGKRNPNRPKKSIVVATQVIEQSLDLDFDYMVSDLAPIDLLIQRAGRLHRHSQNDRPKSLESPTLLIAFPQGDNIPEFGHDEYVYDRSVMLKTWLTVKDKSTISLPVDTTALIESVYGGKIEIKDEALQKEITTAVEDALQKWRKAVSAAINQLIEEPGNEDLLSIRNSKLDEDDPTIHKAFRAMTRNADPSISLICLHRVNGVLYLDPVGGLAPLDISVKPDKELVRQLLRRSISVQNRLVIDYFADNKPEFTWKETAALKYSIPVIFENGRFILKDKKHVLILDRQTGLTIEKEDQ